MTKLWKSKNWIDSFVAFSIGYVMVYFVFSGGAIFMEKFVKQICLFWDFSKIHKNTDFVLQITPPRMHCRNFFLFLSRSIFRWLRRGILQFFCSCCLYGAIYKTKLSVFRFFNENFSSPKEFSLIIFGKIRKTVNFVLLITPQRQRLQKKYTTT